MNRNEKSDRKSIRERMRIKLSSMPKTSGVPGQTIALCISLPQPFNTDGTDDDDDDDNDDYRICLSAYRNRIKKAEAKEKEK